MVRPTRVRVRNPAQVEVLNDHAPEALAVVVVRVVRAHGADFVRHSVEAHFVQLWELELEGPCRLNNTLVVDRLH